MQVPAEAEGGDGGEGGSTLHHADTGRLLLQVHDELIFEGILRGLYLLWLNLLWLYLLWPMAILTRCTTSSSSR
jgi:hypothetical protein